MLDTTQPTPRVAIYARYSSQLQKPTSIDDQIRLCRAKVQDTGGTVVSIRYDRETTGATIDRPGLKELLLDAKNRRIDAIYTEALDRLSRDREDIQGIHKRLLYWDVSLFTLQEGEIQPMHVCIAGLMSHQFLENLAAKTRRGQIGAIHNGRIPGGICYGYRNANQIDDNGQPLRGLREIDPHQASVIRRIYRLYADGTTARDIVALLNREGEPGPRGRAWGHSTVNGHRTRRNGILNNELYRGRIVYGRQRYIRDPDTGKRQARPVPPSEWVIKEVPELRIVDDTLWQRVQQRRQAGQDRRHSTAPKTPLPLTGILRCGVCGGSMSILNKRRYSCHAHREKGICDNPRGIHPRRIENQACSLLSEHIRRNDNLYLLAHEAAEHSHARRDELARRIEDGKTRIRHLIDSIETGQASQAAHKRVLQLEHEIAACETELQSLPELPSVTPDRIAERLQQRLTVLQHAIAADRPDPQRRHRALLTLANLIERIDLVPLPARGSYDLVLQPRPDTLIAFALAEEWRPGAAIQDRYT